MTMPRSEQLAARLREHPPKLDELTRARIENRLLAAHRARRPPRSLATGKWALAAGAVALGAAALVFLTLSPNAESPPVARFERGASAALERGTLEEGSVLRTAGDESAEIRIERSRVRLQAESRVRIARLRPAELALELAKGTLEVEFHPRERGRERLTIETPAARVEVVGTVFRVTVHQSATEVAVSEGAVRVVPSRGGEVRLVRAGEAVRVLSEPSRPSAPDAEEPMAPTLERPAAPEIPEEPSAPPTHGPDERRPTTRPSAPEKVARESAPARPRTPGEQFEEARVLIEAGRNAAALQILRALTRPSEPTDMRVEAWMLIADAHLGAGRVRAAANAYERAAREGHGSTGGHNAIYALARLEHRRLGDLERARASYERYLREAPNGALVGSARRALCALGVSEHCDFEPVESEP